MSMNWLIAIAIGTVCGFVSVLLVDFFLEGW